MGAAKRRAQQVVVQLLVPRTPLDWQYARQIAALVRAMPGVDPDALLLGVPVTSPVTSFHEAAAQARLHGSSGTGNMAGAWAGSAGGDAPLMPWVPWGGERVAVLEP